MEVPPRQLLFFTRSTIASSVKEIGLQGDQSPLWDVRGWKRLTVYEDPPLIAARDEFLSWLDEVPEPHAADLNARLRSDRDDAHLSARLELFIHHYFRSTGWAVQIHPDVPFSSNHPDFLLEEGHTKLLAECKSVFDQPISAQQDQRLRQLADETSRRLNRTVMLHPLSDLPRGMPARRILSWIERQQVPEDSPGLLEFDFWDNHQGVHYGVRAILPKLDDAGEPLVGVHGLMSQVETVTNSQQLRMALQEKASKYGQLDVPYVIAVSMETRFPTRLDHEVEALFGDRRLNIPLRDPVNFSETRANNGFFTSRRSNVPECPDVSAVLLYRFKWLDDGHEHHMHIYHNPYGHRPIEPTCFPNVSQFRRSRTLMKWINGEPESY